MPRPNKLSGGSRGRPSRTVVYERLWVQIGELRERLGGLPSPEEAGGIWRGIWFEEAHHSTAIEGNTLVLRQVEQLLTEGRAVGNKELREYLDVRGYADAADWVYGQGVQAGEWTSGAPISLTELRHIHRLALIPVWDVAPHSFATAKERPGSFREHDIQPFPQGMRPPPCPQVPPLVADWIAEAQSLPSEDLAVGPEALARLHARFERIHPFLDGNGRTGRLVLNLLLVRLGYPPAIVYKTDRSRYLAALRRAGDGDPGPLGELLARAILDNLHRFVVPAVAGPGRLVPAAWFRCRRSRRPRSPRTRCVSRPPAAARRPPERPTAHGAAPAPGSRSTCPGATHAAERFLMVRARLRSPSKTEGPCPRQARPAGVNRSRAPSDDAPARQR